MSRTPAIVSESKLRQAINDRFVGRLVATAVGRKHILNQAAHAEDSDEGQIFDLLLERVDDAKLHKMIEIHRDDEKRHAVMFFDALRRNGFEPTPVLPELSLLDRLDAALGGFFDTFTQKDNPVMEAYLLLQVIEERAVTQFAQMRPHFAKYDPRTATMLDEIGKDEERHLKYCVAISRQYAPDQLTVARTLKKFRTVEAEVFAKLSQGNMRFALENELPDMSKLELELWRGFLKILERNSQPLATPYWHQSEGAAA